MAEQKAPTKGCVIKIQMGTKTTYFYCSQVETRASSTIMTLHLICKIAKSGSREWPQLPITINDTVSGVNSMMGKLAGKDAETATIVAKKSVKMTFNPSLHTVEIDPTIDAKFSI